MAYHQANTLIQQKRRAAKKEAKKAIREALREARAQAKQGRQPVAAVPIEIVACDFSLNDVSEGNTEEKACPLFSIGQIVRNQVTRGIRSRQCERSIWQVNNISEEAGTYKYHVTNMLDGKSKRKYAEYALERGEEVGINHDLSIGYENVLLKKREIVREVVRKESAKQEKLTDKVKALQQQICEKKKVISKSTRIENENRELKKRNRILADECKEVNDINLLTDTRNGSFHSPKALSIRKQVDGVVQALEEKITFLSKENDKRGIELSKVKRDREKIRNAYAEVRRKERAQRKQIDAMAKEIFYLREEAKALEEELEVNPYDIEIQMITMVLAGTSVRMAETIGKDAGGKRKSYINMLRQRLGPMQDIINGLKLALCKNICELGHDGSSLGKYTTLCCSVIIEYEDSSSETIILAASDLPASKSAKAAFDTIKAVFDRLKNRYSSFIQYCKERSVDVSKLPPADGITMSKMAEFSLVMSDHASTATATTDLLREYIQELAEAGISEDRLVRMTAEERENLCRCIKYGCKAHARCLLANNAIAAEDEVMKELVPQAEQQQRMEATLSSLLHAISKEFLPGINQYAKGHQQEFAAFLKSKCPTAVEVNTLRHIGSRMDGEFESAHRVNLMAHSFITFLVEMETVQATDEKSILMMAIKNRLGSTCFKVALAVRGMFWISLFAPLRVMTNSHDLGIRVHTMGLVFDMIEEKLNELQEMPALLMRPGYKVFKGRDFPCLLDFYAKLHDKKLTRLNGDKVFLHDLERDSIYKAFTSDEEIELAHRLIVAMAGGVLESLYRNCSDILTSQDGPLQHSKWTEENIEKAKHCHSDNIKLSESVFSKVDHVYRRGINYTMGHAASLVVAQDGKLFEGAPAVWKERHTVAVIDMSKRDRNKFEEELHAQERAQELAIQNKLREQQELYARKTMKSQLEVVSYFGMPRIREVKTESVLLHIVNNELKAKSEKMNFLKNFINTYVIGYGFADLYKPFSSVKDKSIGSYDDLLQRALSIVKKQLKPPTSPPVKLVPLTSPDQFELVATDEYKEALRVSEDGARAAVDRVMSISEKYGVRLQFPWNSLNRPYWHVDLTELQTKFYRGAKFQDFDKRKWTTYVSAGLSYDTEKHDYFLYYYEESLKPAPKATTDPGVHFSYFKDSHVTGIDSWKESLRVL